MTRELRPGLVALVAGIGRGVRGRTQELGSLLGATARLVSRQPLRWLALAAVVGSAYALAVVVSVLASESLLAEGLLELLWPPLLVLELTAAAFGALAALGGTPFRLRAATSAALERTPPGLVFGIFVLYVYTYGGIGSAALPTSCAAVLALGAWVLPAHVEQRDGLASAVRRTLALSRGDRIPVAAAVSLLAVLAFVAAPLATRALFPAFGRAWGGNGWSLQFAARYLAFVVAALLGPLPAIAAAVAHVELKRRADGRRLARVFE